MEVEKTDVFCCLRRSKGDDKLSYRDLLRCLWGNLYFGRVTRVVNHADHLNIYLNVPKEQEDGSISLERVRLGDNYDCIRSLSAEERKLYVTFEYDFFYGFCGFMNRKQQRSYTLPVDKEQRHAKKQEKVDLDELLVYERGDELEDQEDANTEIDPDDDSAEDPEVLKAKQRIDIDYRLEEELEKDHEFGESSFHFSSKNYCMTALFESILEGTLSSKNGALYDPMNKTDVTVLAPEVGDLVACVPVKTDRGLTAMKWFVVPFAFFEFYKMCMSKSTTVWNMNMGKKLSFPLSFHKRIGKIQKNDGERNHFFSDLAKVVLFNQGRTTNKDVLCFLQMLDDIENKIATHKK